MLLPCSQSGQKWAQTGAAVGSLATTTSAGFSSTGKGARLLGNGSWCTSPFLLPSGGGRWGNV